MSCNHLSDCQRCSHIVEDLEDLVKDLEEEIERLNDDLKAERIALERTVSRIKRSRDEWPLRSRWVKLSEREPNHDDEVFARKTAEDFLTVIYFAEEGDIKYSINGESYIFEDQMDQWEWLEIIEKGGE